MPVNKLIKALQFIKLYTCRDLHVFVYFLLLFTVKDLQESGLSKYIVNHDGDINRRKVLESLNVSSNEKCVPLPLVKNWSTNMGLMPEKFSYTALVEYLIKRQLTFIHSAILIMRNH